MIVAVRTFLFSVWIYGWGIILGIVFLPTLLFGQNAVIGAVRFWAKIVRFGFHWIAGAKIEIRGQEHFPEGAVICAGKHQSTIDVVISYLLVPAPASIMKRELLGYPIFGWYAMFAKNIPIDRGGLASTVRKMQAIAKKRAEEGRQIMIFPEGTRRAPGAEPDYKPGVFGLYKKLEVPIVPVATNSGLCWHRGFMVRPGVIVYEALPAIEPGLDRKTLMTRLELELEAASDRLLDEGLDAQGRTRADL